MGEEENCNMFFGGKAFYSCPIKPRLSDYEELYFWKKTWDALIGAGVLEKCRGPAKTRLPESAEIHLSARGTPLPPLPTGDSSSTVTRRRRLQHRPVLDRLLAQSQQQL